VPASTANEQPTTARMPPKALAAFLTSRRANGHHFDRGEFWRGASPRRLSGCGYQFGFGQMMSTVPGNWPIG
jgi:hypothetical protein